MLLSTLETIPEELMLREHPITLIVGLGMFLSFFLIALAKLVKSDIYLVLLVSFVKNKGLYNYLRESFPVQKTGSMLLLINYCISFSLLLLLVFNANFFNFQGNIWLVGLIPIIVLFYNVVTLYVLGLISGESSILKTPILMKINGAQLLGLGCSILVFLWSLHFIDEQIFITSIISLFVFENTIRLIRSFVYVLAQGVSWYYIIMYLCTLEILPLFMIFYIISAV